MTWQEEKHPRDDEGKFTFKNGGSSTTKETQAELLYGKLTKAEKEKSQTKNKLLQELGNNATPADILYGDNESLMKKIETNKKQKIDNANFSIDEIEKAREFIQGKEGLKLEAYKDTGGVWTIGYGHIKNVKQGDKITKEEAEKLYAQDFVEHIKPLNNVKVSLSKNEKIALASFIYNVGSNAFKNSTLLKKLNNGDKKGAAEEFDKWIYDNGKIQKGLVNRRKKEKNLFLGIE